MHPNLKSESSILFWPACAACCSTLAAIVLLPTILAFLWCLITFIMVLFYARLKNATYSTETVLSEIRQDDTDIFAAETLADALSDPLIFFNRAGDISYINSAAYRYFQGLSRNNKLFSQFRQPEFIALTRNVITTGEVRSAGYSDQSAERRWFSVSIIPIHNNLFVCHFRDQTEARNLERMRADFIANASHELRTPLTSLRGFIDTLTGPAQNDTNAREKFLAIMQEQTARMSRLIDDLLSLSRLETKTSPGKVEPVNMAEIIRHVTDTLAPQATEFGVTVTLALPSDLPEISANRDALIQLFQNLIENALKYGGSGGEVVLKGQACAREVKISVCDLGPGIAAEHLPRLTERFYRVNTNASRAHNGTGLGLAIVKHILTLHRGRLDITSALGKGAVFTVSLPGTEAEKKRR